MKRKTFTGNAADQVQAVSDGGLLHVNATANGQARVLSPTRPNDPPALTNANNTFSAWMDASGQFKLDNWNTTPFSKLLQSTTLVTHEPVETSAFQYDLNGNTILDTTTQPGGSPVATSYEWDQKNQLAAIEVAGQYRTEMIYDGLGRRVRIFEKDGSGAVVSDRYFVWDGLRWGIRENDPPCELPRWNFYGH